MARIEVNIDPIRVMYVEAEGGLSGVSEAWSKLESKLPDLKKRKFYGTYHHNDNVYRACVAINDEEEPKALDLPAWTIPGGKYAREKVMDYSSRVEVIGETFESMSKEYKSDPNRPSIEFYRSQREVILLLPIT
jgi:DNA gyrase inhibitor GyrI